MKSARSTGWPAASGICPSDLVFHTFLLITLAFFLLPAADGAEWILNACRRLVSSEKLFSVQKMTNFQTGWSRHLRNLLAELLPHNCCLLVLLRPDHGSVPSLPASFSRSLSLLPLLLLPAFPLRITAVAMLTARCLAAGRRSTAGLAGAAAR